MKLARGFSRQHRIIHFTTIGSASGLRLICCPDLPRQRPTPLPRDNHRPGWTTFLRHPIAYLLPPWVNGSTTSLRPKTPGRLHGFSINGFDIGRFKAGTGISTGCPSTTPVGLALGPDLPWADQLDPGTLSQSAQEFPTLVSLLMPAFSLVNRPQLASAAASPRTRRSPTHPYTRWGFRMNDTTS